MGNSLSGPKLVKMGTHAAIDMTREKPEREDGGGYSQEWTVSYTTYDESSCTLYLQKVVDQHGRVREVYLELEDDMCFGSGMRMWIRRVQTDLLYLRYECNKSFQDTMMFLTKNQTSNPPGGVTTMNVFCYGKGSKGGLVVLEWKKGRREDMNLCSATVAHYCAIRGGPNKIDTCVSMMVNIWGSNNNLDFAVEGPDRHPPSVLFNMFDLVSRSRSLKPAACPPYAESQRQCSGFSEQSETDSEESETDSETESEGRNIHMNKNITGDANGNIIKGNQKLKRSINFIYNRHKHA